jgi:quercetin dioxygenase-like cupin family protein
MRNRLAISISAAVIVALGAVLVARQTTPAAPGFTRTMLQDQNLSAKDRHGVMSRSDFQPGAESGRHMHPGEEFGYVLEGTLDLTIDGQPTKHLKAGDYIFVATNTVHNAKNAGTGTLRVLSTYVLETGKPMAIPVK